MMIDQGERDTRELLGQIEQNLESVLIGMEMVNGELPGSYLEHQKQQVKRVFIRTRRLRENLF